MPRFQPKPVINARLDQMTKKDLIKTVKTLQKREGKLLNRIAELEKSPRVPQGCAVVEVDARLPNPFAGDWTPPWDDAT